MNAKPTKTGSSLDLQKQCLAITQHAPLPMASVEGARHIVRYANPAFCRLLDQPAEKLVGKAFSEILPEKNDCITLFDRVLRTGVPASHVEMVKDAPHPIFWSYLMWPVLKKESLVGVMLQVTETPKFQGETGAINEGLLLESIRQQELKEAAENTNALLQAEIRERQQMSRELAKKARLLDLSQDAIFVRDFEGRVLYWNHGAEVLYGWSADEVFGKISHALLQTEFSTPLEEITAELYRTDHWTGELVHTCRDGRRITVLARKVLDRDSEGTPVAVLQSITDITERKRAEEAVRAAGERFRFMAESMPQKIFTATPEGEVEYLNQQWTEYTGQGLDQFRNRGWLKIIHPDDVEENVRRWKHSVQTGEYFEVEHRCRRHDGEYRWHISRAHPMRDEEGNITMWIGSNTDIDDMMRAQEELIDAQAQLADRGVHLESLVAERTAELTAAHRQLQAEAEDRKRLEAEVAGAVERERARLGQELHDGLVQHLTGIALLLHVLQRNLMKPAPTLAAEALRLCEMIEKAHQSARGVAKSLYPVELEQHGFLAALREIALRTEQQFGISCVVQADERSTAQFSDAVAIQLFRIAQEAVQNAAKHAGANKIVVCLKKRDGTWILTVKDDGVGLRGAAEEAGGMGLQVMQYRARIIQGDLSVRNNKNGGVTVSCTAPVAPSESEAPVSGQG